MNAATRKNIGAWRGPHGGLWAALAALCTTAFCVAAAGVPVAAQVAQQAEQNIIEESRQAEGMIVRLEGQLGSGEYENAAMSISDLAAVGPEAVLPGSGRGVQVRLREIIYGLSAEARQKLDEAVESAARKISQDAAQRGVPQAYEEIVRRFPGSTAARRALVGQWAGAFEAGEFQRACGLIEAYLADPLVAGPERRTALAVEVVCAAQAHDVVAAQRIAAALQALGENGAVILAGRKVDPRALAEQVVKQSGDGASAWPMLGAPGRVRTAATAATLGGPLAFGQEGSDAPLDIERLPTRQEMLQRRASEDQVTVEQTVVVTEHSVLATRGNLLLAFERVTGDELWRLALTPEALPLMGPAWPSCGDGYVAVVTQGAYAGPRAVLGGRFVEAQAGNLLVVVREGTGEVVWSWPGTSANAPAAADVRPRVEPNVAPQARPGAPGIVGGAELRPGGSPLIYGGRVYVGAMRPVGDVTPTDSFLLCFDLLTGKLLWQRFVGGGTMFGYARGTSTIDRMVPATDGRRIYVESPFCTLSAIDLATGDVAWSRGFHRPFEPSPGWPAGIADAPMIVGRRLLMTNIYGLSEDSKAGENPQIRMMRLQGIAMPPPPASEKSTVTMRCLDAETGQTVWPDAPIVGAYRLGVADGLVFVAGGQSLAGYDLESGQEKFSKALPAPATGRGFVAETGIYVPTAAGIVCVNWRDGGVKTVSDAADGGPALALAPLAENFISSQGRRLELFGPVKAFAREIERGHAAHPDDPTWTRRLAELYRRQDDYPAAEAQLKAAVEQAARLSDATRSRSEQLFSYRRLGRLYREWAETLSRAGRSAEAPAKFDLASRFATSPGAKVTIQMALAEHYERAGDPLQAAASYAQVAASEAAQHILVKTKTLNLEHTLALAAQLALERVRGAPAAPAGPVVLQREDVAQLTVERVAMISWNLPSYLMSQNVTSAAPLIWARGDGLVAFGPQGEVRWRYAHLRDSQGSVPEVCAGGGLALEKRDHVITALRLNDGAVAWQWKIPEQRVFGQIAAAGMGRQRIVRRVQIVNGKVVQFLTTTQQEPLDNGFPDFMVAGGTAVTTTTGEGPGAEWRVHGIDLAAGSDTWVYSVPEKARLVSAGADENRILLLTQSPNTGEMTCVGLDAATGTEAWRRAIRSVRFAWMSLACERGVVIFSEPATTLIEASSGKILWQEKENVPATRQLLTVADDAVLFNEMFTEGTSLTALDRRTSEVRWKVSRAVLFHEGDAWGPVTALAAGGTVMVSNGASVAAVRLSDGALLWRSVLPAPWAECGLLQCGDMVVVYGSLEPEARLRFLDTATGKLLGEVSLGACAAALRVQTMPGGLLALNGKEVLAVWRGGSAP